MIFDYRNIYLNCTRLIVHYENIITYICITACSTSIFHNGNKALHSLVYSGGWFFIYRPARAAHKGKVYACTALATYIIGHGANLFRCLQSMLLLYISSVAFLRFRVSESGLRYAHKTPFFSTSKDKNSTLENSHNSMQCPKPDNMRPKKAILPFFWESLERNNGLTLGRLVSIVQVNAGLWHLGFLREKGLCLN